jgi:hypothetical protein
MTERELLTLCLRWIEDSPEDAFDRAMLVDAIKAKLAPRPWVSLTTDEYQAILDRHEGMGMLAFYHLIENKLREKNA